MKNPGSCTDGRVKKSRRRFFGPALACLGGGLFLLEGLLASPLLAGDRSPVAVLGWVPDTSHPAETAGQGRWQEELKAALAIPRLPLLEPGNAATTLDRWTLEEKEREAALRTVRLAVRGEVERMRKEGWEAYFRFDFPACLEYTALARKALENWGEPALAAEADFDLHMLEGMALSARGDSSADQAFLAAARQGAGRRLPPERFSPEIQSRFEKARKKAVAGPRSVLWLTADASEAQVSLDGEALGPAPLEGLEIYPGRHYLGVTAPGRRPQARTLDLGEWETVKVSLVLESAPPSGDPAGYYLGRLEAGDMESLSSLFKRLGVPSVLLGRALRDPDGKPGWEAILAGGEGETLARKSFPGSKEPSGEMAAWLEAAVLGRGGIKMGEEVLLSHPKPISPPEVKKGKAWYWILGGAAVAAGVLLSLPDDENPGSEVTVIW